MNINHISNKRTLVDSDQFLDDSSKKQRLEKTTIQFSDILDMFVITKISNYLCRTDLLNLQMTSKTYQSAIDIVWKTTSPSQIPCSLVFKNSFSGDCVKDVLKCSGRTNKITHLFNQAVVNYLIWDQPILREVKDFNLMIEIEKNYQLFTENFPIFKSYLFKNLEQLHSSYPPYYLKLPPIYEQNQPSNCSPLLKAFLEYENYCQLSNETDKQQSLNKIKSFFNLSIEEGNYLTSFLALYLIWDEVPLTWHLDLIFKCTEKGNQKSILLLDKILNEQTTLIKHSNDNEYIVFDLFKKIKNDLLINMKNNVKLVNFILQKNASNFKYLSNSLQNNVELAQIAVQRNAYILCFMPKEIAKNLNIVKLAIQQNGLILEFVSKKLQNHLHIVQAAVQQNGLALEFASEQLCNNLTIVKSAIKQNPFALQFASKSLQNKPEIKNFVRQQHATKLARNKFSRSDTSIAHKKWSASQEKTDKKIIQSVLKQNLTHQQKENLAKLRYKNRIFSLILKTP